MSRLPRRLAPFLLAAIVAAPLAGCGDLSLSRAAGVPTSLEIGRASWRETL